MRIIRKVGLRQPVVFCARDNSLAFSEERYQSTSARALCLSFYFFFVAQPLSRECCYNNWLFHLIWILTPPSVLLQSPSFIPVFFSFLSLLLIPSHPDGLSALYSTELYFPCAPRLADLWRRIFKVNKTFRLSSSPTSLSPPFECEWVPMTRPSLPWIYTPNVTGERCWKTYLDSSGAIHVANND